MYKTNKILRVIKENFSTAVKKQESIYRTSVNVLLLRNWRVLLRTHMTFVMVGRFCLALNTVLLEIGITCFGVFLTCINGNLLRPVHTWQQKSPKTETKSLRFRQQMATFCCRKWILFVTVFGDFCCQVWTGL